MTTLCLLSCDLQGREEQKKQRQLDLERLLQRYQNVKSELESQQNIERIRSEKFMSYHLSAFAYVCMSFHLFSRIPIISSYGVPVSQSSCCSRHFVVDLSWSVILSEKM